MTSSTAIVPYRPRSPWERFKNSQQVANAAQVLPPVLAGLPIAFGAMQELQSSVDDPVAGIGGAFGQLAGGIPGGMAGAGIAARFDGRLAPVGFALGSLFGGQLGGGVGRGIGSAVSGEYNDPANRQIRAAQKAAQMARNEAIASLPLQRAQGLIEAEMRARDLYAQAGAAQQAVAAHALYSAALGNYGGYIPGSMG